MAKGLLIRVGIDLGSGGWNAPCGNDGRFCYVPIPADGVSRGPVFDRLYSEFIPHAIALGVKEWPQHLAGTDICHLDPDFSHLTYGDWNSKGKRIQDFLAPGDFIVFWAGLKSVDANRIICSIIGFYIVSYIVNATEIGCLDWHRNAHTRQIPVPKNGDIVVFAKPELSGRLRRYIKIGESREGKQRILPELLKKWGPKALCKKDGSEWKNGFIHRSGALPSFGQPDKFLKWFYEQNPEFIHANNI